MRLLNRRTSYPNPDTLPTSSPRLAGMSAGVIVYVCLRVGVIGSSYTPAVCLCAGYTRSAAEVNLNETTTQEREGRWVNMLQRLPCRPKWRVERLRLSTYVYSRNKINQEMAILFYLPDCVCYNNCEDRGVSLRSFGQILEPAMRTVACPHYHTTH